MFFRLTKLYIMCVVLFLALGITHTLQTSNNALDGDAKGNSALFDSVRQVPDRTLMIYTVITLALWIFRNDFPFNLIILLLCSFGAGRLTSDLI